jgi:hypothetical protein
MAKSSTTFKKGEAKGRPKGVENKTTRDIKEAFKNLIEMNLDNMTIWLKKVAAKNPAQALFIISNLAEYTTPKLARSQVEHSGEINTSNISNLSTEELVKRAEAAKSIEKK